MRLHHSAATGVTAAVAVSLILFTGTMGCSSTRTASKTTPAAAGSNTNSRGLPKLTAAEVEEKIKAVQASTTFPESAKPKIIESIRSQGEP